jgi:methionine-rich copper-binding protein CopC
MRRHDPLRDITGLTTPETPSAFFVHRLSGWGTVAVLLGAILAFAAPGVAFAHAKFASANPTPNAILTAAPSAVTITFTEDLDPSGSDIVVFDETGKQVSVGKGRVDTTHPKNMTVQMHGDDSEAYAVVWRTKSLDDGDAFTGAYSFTVSKDATPSPGNAEGGSQGGASSGGTPLWATVLVGLLGLVVGAGGAVFLMRRSAT